MGNVEVTYSIIAVEIMGAEVVLSIRRTEEARGPTVLPQRSPIASTEEEKIGQRMVQGALEAVKHGLEFTRSPFDRPKIPLSLEEYEKLGKPTVNDLLTVTLVHQGEE